MCFCHQILICIALVMWPLTGRLMIVFKSSEKMGAVVTTQSIPRLLAILFIKKEQV